MRYRSLFFSHMTPEGKIENYLENQCKKRGYLCFKFKALGHNGVPDRIIVAYGITVYVELKAPGKEPRADQKYVIKQLKKHGAYVFVADSKDTVNSVLTFIEGMKKES